jgi:rfaE bifunctional protein kinase chain/domain
MKQRWAPLPQRKGKAGTAAGAGLRDRLLRILDQFARRSLVVAGDLIADQFLYGEIARVSREAPVLVLQYRDLITVPGGAANAANNLLDLGCHVRMEGAVGNDESGRILVEALANKGADVDDVQRLESYATPVKTRILAGALHSSPQQIVRVDRVGALDSNFRIPEGRLRARLSSVDGIILSDYGYGCVTPSLVETAAMVAAQNRIPVVADSRFRMTGFKGVTSITPNITELESALGVSIGSSERLLQQAGRRVIQKQRLAHLLVTQGRFGMTLLEAGRPPTHIPIFGTDEVADVTGAGDTVIAVFTLALACGGSPEEAARLANYAGGIVVMKRGTATVAPEELRTAINRDLSS